jgi:hypothetical protein
MPMEQQRALIAPPTAGSMSSHCQHSLPCDAFVGAVAHLAGHLFVSIGKGPCGSLKRRHNIKVLLRKECAHNAALSRLSSGWPCTNSRCRLFFVVAVKALSKQGLLSFARCERFCMILKLLQAVHIVRRIQMGAPQHSLFSQTQCRHPARQALLHNARLAVVR